MLDTLQTYLKEGFSYTGLEICQQGDSERYFLIRLKKTKGELLITDKITLTLGSKLEFWQNK